MLFENESFNTEWAYSVLKKKKIFILLAVFSQLLIDCILLISPNAWLLKFQIGVVVVMMFLYYYIYVKNSIIIEAYFARKKKLCQIINQVQDDPSTPDANRTSGKPTPVVLNKKEVVESDSGFDLYKNFNGDEEIPLGIQQIIRRQKFAYFLFQALLTIHQISHDVFMRHEQFGDDVEGLKLKANYMAYRSYYFGANTSVTILGSFVLNIDYRVAMILAVSSAITTFMLMKQDPYF